MAKMMKDNRISTPFSLLHAASLLGQRTRILKFAEAIQRVVKPKTRVVDIGTGSGVLAMLAAQAGASEVTAIDINADSIEYAKMAARMNGLEERIQFEVTHFIDFIPKKRYDVIICEMLSSMMLIEQQIPASRHAVEHLMKPDGIMIPRSLTIYVALTQCDHIWSRFRVHNLKFPRLPQTITKGETIDLSDLIEVAQFDLTALDMDSKVETTVEMKVIQKGEVHGLVGLFDGVVHEDIRLNPDDGWRELFIPFEKSIQVIEGDEIVVKLEFTPGELDTLVVQPE
ncbi:MAG: 50S ribosomal protein L11 methyltransferase [Candidatus Thorarchaeota archaeon]|nr:50S ribosomal protein L11 methyltransferase [Candidatus Thorarchaeota archaeon]